MGLEIVNETKIVKGKIEKKIEKKTIKGKTYYSITIDGNFYNYFGKDEIEEGDIVELSLEKNEQGYWNIKKLEKVGNSIPTEDLSDLEVGKGSVDTAGTAPNVCINPEDRKQTSIVRQLSIKCATNLACVFLQWRLNEADDEEKKALQSMELVAYAPQITQLAETLEKWIKRKD